MTKTGPPCGVHVLLAAHYAAGRSFRAARHRQFRPESGPGEPVLFVHGMWGASFLYRKVLRELARRGVRGVVFDPPGFGFAQRPAQFDYTLDRPRQLRRGCRARPRPDGIPPGGLRRRWARRLCTCRPHAGEDQVTDRPGCSRDRRASRTGQPLPRPSWTPTLHCCGAMMADAPSFG
jgi:hypothetical protein